VKQGLIRNGIKSWDAHMLSSAERQEAVGGFLFSNKQRTGTLQPHNFRRDPKHNIFKCIYSHKASFSAFKIEIL
jgi:hypothetical protein